MSLEADTVNVPKPTTLPVYLDDAGTPRTTSKDVAREFKNEPQEVNRKIRDLLRDGPAELRDLMFQEVSAFDPAANRMVLSYTMTRDGFALLAMSFTGPEVPPFKLAWLKRFNELEAESRERHANPSSGSRDDALIAALTIMAQTQTSLMQVMQRWMQGQQQAQPQAPQESTLPFPPSPERQCAQLDGGRLILVLTSASSISISAE